METRSNNRQKVSGYIDLPSLAVLGYDRTEDGGTGLMQAPAIRLAWLVERNTPRFERDEWNAILDAMNGTAELYDWTCEQIAPQLMVAANLHDTPGLSEKWKIDVAGLIKRVRRLNDIEGEAILCAVRWAWRNCNEFEHEADEWWTPEFRRSHVPPPSADKRRKWTDDKIALLGTATDEEIAEKLGVSKQAVTEKRASLGITPWRKHRNGGADAAAD